MKKIPIIGMTKKFHPKKSLSLDYIAKNVDRINFLNKILPTDQIEVKSINKDYIQIVYNKPLNYQIISELKIEMDLKIEQQIPDEISPLIWNFSTKNSSHFYEYSGRIRAKRVGKDIKIGLFIYEIKLDNENITKFGLRAMKNIIKELILQIFQNLTKL
ncbi:hypothetical protein DSAG12_00806 [Promethearchaeum syntrophicum]|uniref:Uncharacterized protein n=1 Tax=Promethearchaeum syntrophicum TaxID=2594042 RepID=A0A5B9D7J5_9ARCH|nr:hypothetical protein [Candidatus Prometheoarchaeum syntrophicum]QEE14983.1 hypothetical protein DSAG12_00806 [Candidatus Prometheoarchaeum syntrophicum]